MNPLALAALSLLVLAPPARAQPVVPWQEAGRHVGEEVTVEGVVAAVHCSPLACSLAFEPSFARFTAIVQARSFAALPPEELERRYKGRRVRIRGEVETIDGKPRIEVSVPAALALAEEPARDARSDAAEAEADAREAELEVLDRLEALIERTEALAERLAVAEERIVGLLAALDERERALAAVAAGPPPPGSGAARPASQALRGLKRGMTTADAQRLAGRPLAVVDNGRGWTTWDYGDGRSITFDARGRAQSLTGFGTP